MRKAEEPAFHPLVSFEIPEYLRKIYWWAYIHPRGVNFFQHQWIVNSILWGNFARLRDLALDEIGPTLHGRSLQVACVYGDFTQRLAARLAPGAELDVVDALPIQLSNLRSRLPEGSRVALYQRDSSALGFEDAGYDQVIVFFLLHEQPEPVRRGTLAEALRVLKKGGRLVIVDYHLPGRTHPLRYLMRPALAVLEPFALDLWRHGVETWLPQGFTPARMDKQTYFGGLYQKVVIRA